MTNYDLDGDTRTSCETREACIEVPGNCDRLRNPASISEFESLSIAFKKRFHLAFLEKRIS